VLDTDDGTGSAYGQQMTALGLRPWEFPPVWIDPDEIAEIIFRGPGEWDLHNKYDAARLLQKMLRYGVPADAPDPMLALSLARATRRSGSR
jgi:hypothetical protein